MVTETEKHFGLVNASNGREVRLAMEELNLTGRLLPAGAHLFVTHAFRSDEAKPLEVIYSFPLPRDAALKRFQVIGEGFQVNSELKPVEEAREEYERGIENGHLSTMAQAYKDGLVNLNVGNIQPVETVQVKLEIVAGVELHDDGFRFRFPFTMAPCYHREARAVQYGPREGELELPEAKFGDLILPTWTADEDSLHAIGFDLAVEKAQDVLELSSPSHAIRVQNTDESQSRIMLAVEKEIPDRDLILDVKYEKPAPLVVGGPDDGAGYHFVGVIPSETFGKAEQAAREIVFVVDRSGSMEGAPMEQARRSVEACLGALSEEDRFGIVAFDDRVEVLSSKLLLGDSNGRLRAKEFLGSIEARGGTELLRGVEEGVGLLSDQGGDVLLITDGQVYGGEEIVQEVRCTGTRIHCLGIGSASQDRFLTLLSRETGGVSRFQSPRERVDLAALGLFSSIGRPVAEEIRCEAIGGAEIMPGPPEVVFHGTPVVVYGSSEDLESASFRLNWNSGGEAMAQEFSVVEKEDRSAASIKLLRGARLIVDLEAQAGPVETRGPVEKRRESRLTQRLENLSREYGLASQAMSLVAVVERASDQPGELPETRVVPVGMPQDVRFHAYFEAVRPLAFRDTAVEHCAAVLEYCADESFARPFFSGRGARSFLGAFRDTAMADDDEAARMTDLCIEVCSMIQSDGGMPGKDLEERVLATFIALGLLIEDEGLYRHHIERLREFITNVEVSGLEEEPQGRVGGILELLKDMEGVGCNWKELADGFVQSRRISSSEVWMAIHQSVGMS